MSQLEDEDNRASDADQDEDEALQEALACGKLKPGLYGQFAQVVTQNGKIDKEGLKNAYQTIRLDLGWIERLDLTTGLAPLSRSAYEAVGVDFDEEAVKELEDLEAALSGKENVAAKSDDASEAKRKRNAANSVRRAERSIVGNDFVREMHFYRQAQAAAVLGISKLHEEGVVTLRPADYFAEMAKSDVHMKRVRDRLLHLENRLAIAEKAKRIRDARRFAKEAERERVSQTKSAAKQLDALVDSVRSGKRSAADLERELGTETSRAKQLAGTRVNKEPGNKKQKREPKRGAGPAAAAGAGAGAGAARRDQGRPQSQPRRNKKREKKNEKYGFGGQKKRAKWNTRESNENVDKSYKQWRSTGGPGKFKAKKGASQRPGKRSRQRSRNKQ